MKDEIYDALLGFHCCCLMMMTVIFLIPNIFQANVPYFSPKEAKCPQVSTLKQKSVIYKCPVKTK